MLLSRASRHGFALILFGFLSTLTLSTPVLADRENMALEEVVVTARKRGESLIDIPESVVSISGDAIGRQNIKGLDKIGLAVPNLN